MIREKRECPGKEIKIPLIYSYNDSGRLKSPEVIRIARNISEGGFYFLDEQELTSGTCLFIKLNIIEKVITCQGIVVSCDRQKDPYRFDIRVRFTVISETDREKICSFSEVIFD